MKVLLTMNVPYTRANGGANRFNRGFCEALAARGHTVEVVVPVLATPSQITYEEHVRQLEAKGIRFERGPAADSFNLDGVVVHAVREAPHVRSCLEERLRIFNPDGILVSSEDPSQNLLAAALKHSPRRVVYLALTPPLFPFGPESLYPGEARKELVRQTAAVVTIGKFAAEYVKKWCGVEAHIIHSPSYGRGPFRRLASFDNPYILLMNASGIKGLSIFMELARRFPGAQFGALPGYGTTEADRRAMAALPNVSLLENAENLDDIFQKIRLLLMPSLWLESFGLAAVDAMLRGIPVLASNFGGLLDAKLGTDYLLPVNPIESFADNLDSNLLPAPVIPEQPMDVWAAVLGGLLSDRPLYERQSEAAHRAALGFVSTLDIAPLEKLLAKLETVRSPAPAADPARPSNPALNMAKSTHHLMDSIAELTPLQREVLARKLQKKSRQQRPGAEPPARISLRPVEHRDATPLSFAQQRIWFVQQLDPRTPAFNMPGAKRLPGQLHLAALRAAIDEVVRRHETLRTWFEVQGGEPVQRVQAAGRVPLPVIDLSGLIPPDREIEVRRLAFGEALAPFDLTRELPLRARLVRLDIADHLVLYTVHHIASDAWSNELLDAELRALYAAFAVGKPSPLPALPVQYRDFTVWQRQWLRDTVLEKELGYWKEKLAGAPATLELPADRPPAKGMSHAAAVHRFVLPAVFLESLKTIAAREDVTPFMILLAAFDTVLFRYTGQSDLLVSTPIANRNHPEIEKLIGFFANALVLRCDLGGDLSFQALLKRVKEATLGAYAHQDLPFEKLVEELRPERDSGYSPFTPVIFMFQRTSDRSAAGPEMEAGFSVDSFRIAKADLAVSLIQAADGLIGVIEYRSDLFGPNRIRRMARHFERVLEQAMKNPGLRLSEFELQDRDEVQRLDGWNATHVPDDDRTIISLIEEHAASREADAAAVFGAETICYGELNRRANQLAHYLRELGVGPEVMVGVLMEPSLDLMVAVLGIWKAGGAYVPVDPRYPRERRDYMLSDSGLAMIVTGTAWEDEEGAQAAIVVNLNRDRDAIGGQSEKNPMLLTGPRNLAYVIYTSGSTGSPKGVLIEHRGLTNVIREQRRQLCAGSQSRVLQFASLSFDASIFEMAMALGTGGTLFLGRRGELLPGRELAEWLDDKGITHVTLPPSALAVLPEKKLPALRTLMVAGEECSRRLVDRWAPGIDFFNLYGPTEATIWATAGKCVAGQGKPTIGTPIGNVQIRLLDPAMCRVPVGVLGELCIGGVGVARGYLGRPDWTAEKFIPDPWGGVAGNRLYRTGDLARYGEDGRIEFLGRKDHQVKVRGFRIELGEIEALLKAEPEVQDAFVVVLERDEHNKRLSGYYVLRPGAAISSSQMMERLKSKLPEHAVPSTLTPIGSLPRMPNGKVDRKNLPADETQPDEAAGESGERLSLVEEMLRKIWMEVLAVETVGVEQNFFEVGGHSLLATQLMARIEEAFAVELQLQHFFETPTIRGLAERLHQTATSGISFPWSPMVPIKPTGSLPPIFLVHPYSGRADLYARFVKYLHPEQPVYGVQAKDVVHPDADAEVEFNSLEEMAAYYIRAISTIAPRGPYSLGGYSYGGNIIFEMAQQLVSLGHEVALLAIIGSNLPKKLAEQQEPDESDFVMDTLHSVDPSYDWMSLFPGLKELEGEERLKYMVSRLKDSKRIPESYDFPLVQRLARRAKKRFLCVANYVPRVYPGEITLFRTQGMVDDHLFYDWNELSARPVQVCDVPGNHLTMVAEPHVEVLSRELNRRLTAVSAAFSTSREALERT